MVIEFMPKAQEVINLEKRQYIIKTLEWFDLTLSSSDLQKLEKDNNVSVSAYLDQYLLPCISNLNDNQVEGSLWGNKESIQFRGLISLCFKGDLSKKVWDKVWSILTEKEQIFYATTDFYLGGPLQIAVNAGNLEGIKRLDAIYKDLLPKYPERRFSMHWQLRSAILNSRVNSPNEQQCLALTLELCDRYAEKTNANETTQRFSNKQLAYKKSGLYVGNGFTTLLDMFSEVCETLVSNQNVISLKQVYYYLMTNGITQEEFSSFNARVKTKLQELIKNDSECKFCKTAVKIVEQAENLFTNQRANEMQPGIIERQTPNLSEKVENSDTDSSIILPTSRNDVPDELIPNVESIEDPTPSLANSSTNMFFKNKPTTHSKTLKDRDINPYNSSLTIEQIAEVRKLIGELKREIKSCWPYPNKERKAEKVTGLIALLTKAKTLDANTAVEDVEKEFPEIRKGGISTRTAELLDNLKKDKKDLKI